MGAGSEEIVLYKERPVPTDGGVLWFPIELGPRDRGADSYVRFLTRGALRQIANHVAATEDPDEPGQLGFLLGELFRCPETHARYAVIDYALPSAERVREDRTSSVLAGAWKRLHELPRGDRGHVLGWYHVHTRGDLRLSNFDVTAHNRFFTQPWQTAIILEPSERGARGIVCRPDRGWPGQTALMPFYEISDPGKDSEEAEVPFTWEGYRRQTVRARSGEWLGRLPSQRASGERGDRPASKVVLPQELDRALEEEEGRRRRGASGGLRRFAWATLLLVAAAGAAWWLDFLPSASDPTLPDPVVREPVTQEGPRAGAGDRPNGVMREDGTEPAGASAVARLDELADEVERAVAGYRERARLYGNDQMTCADLGRGLIGVEDAWTAYNVRGRSAVPELDARRADRDELLYEQVQQVERQFAATGCSRP